MAGANGWHRGHLPWLDGTYPADEDLGDTQEKMSANVQHALPSASDDGNRMTIHDEHEPGSSSGPRRTTADACKSSEAKDSPAEVGQPLDVFASASAVGGQHGESITSTALNAADDAQRTLNFDDGTKRQRAGAVQDAPSLSAHPSLVVAPQWLTTSHPTVAAWLNGTGACPFGYGSTLLSSVLRTALSSPASVDVGGFSSLVVMIDTLLCNGSSEPIDPPEATLPSPLFLALTNGPFNAQALVVRSLLLAGADPERTCRVNGEANESTTPNMIADAVYPGLLSALAADRENSLPPERHVQYSALESVDDDGAVITFDQVRFDRMMTYVEENDMCSRLTSTFRVEQLQVLTNVLQHPYTEYRASMIDDLLTAEHYYVDAFGLQLPFLPPLFTALLQTSFPSQAWAVKRLLNKGARADVAMFVDGIGQLSASQLADRAMPGLLCALSASASDIAE